MSRLIRIFSLLFYIGTYSAFAQTITIGTVDAGPYGKGSTIAVPIKTADTDGKILADNTFKLYISDATGSFANEIEIGYYNSFFSTFVNGIIPANTVAGNYKVRVKSTSPVIVSNPSNIFQVSNAGAVTASIDAATQTISTSPKTFGSCGSGRNNQRYNFVNSSTAGASVTASFTNGFNASDVKQLTFNGSSTEQFIAEITHYTIMVKAIVNGITGTQAYFLINNTQNTPFSTFGNNTVCLPSGLLEYGVDISGTSGIQSNFPGFMYRVNWGDQAIETYTFNQIKANDGKVRHVYFKSSCGSSVSVGTQRYYNVFGIGMQLMSPFCNEIGTPVSTQAKVITQPENRFGAPEVTCLNTLLTIFNNSIAGENPSSTSPECDNNDVVYYWYVDNIPVTPKGVTIGYPLKHIFTTPGLHIIRLESESSSDCQAAPMIRKIQVQMPPKPAFTLDGNLFCLSSVIKATNTSVLDNATGVINTHQWVITGPSAPQFVNGTTSNSENAEFKFTESGNYAIKLIVNSSCSPVASSEQTFTVNSVPEITANWQTNICGKGQLLTFSNTQGNPVTTAFAGTFKDEADTYTWEVLTPGYSFKDGTTSHSKKPVIFFENYGVYTIRITVKNNCGVKTITKTLTFSESPTVFAGADLTICAGNSAQLKGTITGPLVASFAWVGGKGTFIPNRNSLNAEYIPSADEVQAAEVQLSLSATTSNPAPCDKVADVVVLKINPPNKIISANAANVCTDNELIYNPIAFIENSMISWTAVGTSNAGEFRASGTGEIKDTYVNTDPNSNAVITYTIIPEANGCPGQPFTYTVTITPTPTVQAQVTNQTICTNQAVDIQLTPGTLYTWTVNSTGSITGFNPQSTPVTTTHIQDILVNTGNTAATVTYIITPTNSTGCAGDATTVTITIAAKPVSADAGIDQKLCNATSVKLNANHPGNGTGKWLLLSGQAEIVFDADNKTDALVSGLKAGQVYRFKWTITGPGSCGSSADEVVINNLNELAANTISYPAHTVCEGATVNIIGSVPTGGDAEFTYSWETSTDGLSWLPVNASNTKNLDVVVTQNMFFRRSVKSGDCSSVSGVVQVDVQKGITNNNISANQHICVNTAPSPLIGTIPEGADGTFKYQWQQSTDGLSWSLISSATNVNYQPSALSKTTFFRRVVSSNVCTGSQQNYSNNVEIKISNGAIANFNWTSESACAPFTLTAQVIKAEASEPGDTYTWYAGTTFLGTGINFPGYELKNAGDTVLIKLEVKSALGCNTKTFAHTFKTNSTITAKFTADKVAGCGTVAIQFTNQTINREGVSFEWNFGNGQKSYAETPSAITFNARTDGKDTTYVVILKAVSSCAISSDTAAIKVVGQPVPRFTLSTVEGCSPLKVTFKNLSLGSGNTYTWSFGDGKPDEVYTDNRSVVHTYLTSVTKNFTVTLSVKNACGEKTLSHLIKVAPNTVKPDLVVNANQLSGCAPHTVTFYNYTTGATKYAYVFDDGSDTLYTISDDPIEHTFKKGGVYNVKLISSNCSDTIVVKKITVFHQAETNFTADVTEGCAPLAVKFTNKTANAISYYWDFGNGSTYNGQHPPQQVFSDTKTSYTVKLITKSNNGCMDTLVMKDYIKVNSYPVAAFDVLPGTVIQYPNYRFTFKNTSTGNSATIAWDFGDGSALVNNVQSPEHLYPDTGMYNVKLMVKSQYGCTNTIERVVRITGTPGQLFMANAFMPNSLTEELRLFRAKGSGIEKWHFRIFNKWGEVIWKTDKLDAKGAPVEGWDGTFNGKPAPQGIYFWEVAATFKNGTQWAGMSYNGEEPKKTGAIHLIR